MNKVLRKRLLRDLRENIGRYAALIALIAMGIFLVTSIVGSSETIISGTNAYKSINMVEDGQFSVFLPLTDDEIAIVSAGGTDIEKMFSLDLTIKQGQKVRMFKNREHIDLIQLDVGRLAENDGEAVIEKRFAEVNGINTGDVLTAGGHDFVITGIGSVPDYDNMLSELSDTAVQSESFGLIFVTPHQYDTIRESGTQKAENLTYAYRLGNGITDDEIKDRIKNIEFDAAKVEDKYFRETIDDILNDRKKIEESIDELCDATVGLDDGAKKLYDGTDELSKGAKELSDNIDKLSGGADDLSDGAKQLKEGAKKVDDGAVKLDTGAKQLSDGTGELSASMKELRSYGMQLSAGTDELIDGYLATVGSSLSGYGINITLTRDNYREVLDGLAVMSGQSEITDLRQSLDSLIDFRNGISTYTNNVIRAADGAEAVSDGVKELKEGTSSLRYGTAELRKGANALSDGAMELSKGAGQLSAGASELSGGAEELKEGADELSRGTGEFRENADTLKHDMDELLDRVFEIDIENLTSFIKQADNIRINAAASDVVLNKIAGLVTGIILLILLAYVISVFVVHQIERETGVIGALYALGVRKKDLLRHYITLPTMIAFIGGSLGFLIALTPIGIKNQMTDSYNYFSIPVFKIVYPAYLLVYAFVMPAVISAVVNVLVIDHKLSRTALSLMKNEQSGAAVKQFRIKTDNFRTMFAIRQLVREARSGVTVLLGMFFSLLIILLACNTYTLCKNVKIKNTADTRYEYMYMYKYPAEEIQEGGEKAFVKTLSTYDTGYDLPVTVIGLDEASSYFDAHPEKSMNKAVINNSINERLGYKIGDKVTFTDDAAEKSYTFIVTDICEYSPGFTIFMDRESMCELFGEEDDHYNVIYSDRELDIEAGRLYNVTTKSDIERASGVFIEQMQTLIWTLMIAGTIIFCVVMYLMMGVMIDRSAFGISLIKIFGYRSREVRSLYLNGNFVIVAVGGLICLPLAKTVIDIIYPSFIANVACCMDVSLSPELVFIIYAAMIGIYIVINELLVFKVKRITPAEVLKNRE